MARETRLLLNCTGPYRFLGEPVRAWPYTYSLVGWSGEYASEGLSKGVAVTQCVGLRCLRCS
jgi:hypothetical protein